MSLKTVRSSPRGSTGTPRATVRDSYPHGLDPAPSHRAWSILPLVALAALSWIVIWACVLAVMDAIP